MKALRWRRSCSATTPGRPSGRNLAQILDQLPPMMDYNIRDGRTYMYFKGEPLYPFGFGLSYTTFKLSNLKTSSRKSRKTERCTVSVDVTNTGSRAGDEVVQLYVKHLGSKVERPREQLVGFQRVTVQPNETKTVEIALPAFVRLACTGMQFVKTHRQASAVGNNRERVDCNRFRSSAWGG
jgi:beta-glucosidase